MMIVDVEHLSVHFQEFKAVDNISFQVSEGEIFGFLGANGAGKTTTIRVLCGLISPTGGVAHVAGFDATTEGEMIKKKIGYMSQKATLYEDLTINENLEFIASLHRLTRSQFLKRRDELMEIIHFKGELDVIIKNLPSGMRQQVALTASLLHDPLILFLDEPTAGVSPKSRYYFWQLIKDLTQKGKTIFVTTHYMDEAEECHRIALMQAGKIVALDTPANLKTTYFPDGLLLLTPIQVSAPSPFNIITNAKELISLDPFGLKYHLKIKQMPYKNEIIKKLEPYYTISPMAPTLEDVFLHVIEGKDKS